MKPPYVKHDPSSHAESQGGSILIKQYGRIGYLCFIKNTPVLVLIFSVGWVMGHDAKLAALLCLIYAVHVSVHEFGHIFFLERYHLPYQIRGTRWGIELAYCPQNFSRLKKKQKLCMILSGSLWAIIFDVLLIVMPSPDGVATFAALLIVVEGLNPILGKDAKVFEQTLKERSR